MRSTLPRKPLIPGLYHVVPLDRDRVQVCNAGRSVVLSGPGFAERMGPLLAALDGFSSLAELEAKFGDSVGPVLHGLLGKGLLTEAADQRDSARAAPQRGSFGLSTAPPLEVATTLAEATVVLSGCGPVGCTIAVLLAKAGLGQLLVGDETSITAADISVATVLAPEHEGQRRAEATRDLCLAVSSSAVEVISLPLDNEVLLQSDLAVIELVYQDQDGLSVDADLCLSRGLPHLLVHQDALQAVVGPRVGPGGNPCHRCLDARRRSLISHLPEHLAYRQYRAEVAPRSDVFLAAHCSMVAGTLATEALKAVLREESPACGGILTFEFAAMRFSWETLLAVPGCEGCSAAEENEVVGHG